VSGRCDRLALASTLRLLEPLIDARLTWPIVIAAFNLMPHDPARLTALSLLSEFGQYACFDNGAACRVMTEFYQHEEVVGCMTPAEVTMRLRSKPFLD